MKKGVSSLLKAQEEVPGVASSWQKRLKRLAACLQAFTKPRAHKSSLSSVT